MSQSPFQVPPGAFPQGYDGARLQVDPNAKPMVMIFAGVLMLLLGAWMGLGVVLSVRDVEALSKEAKAGTAPAQVGRAPTADPNLVPYDGDPIGPDGLKYADRIAMLAAIENRVPLSPDHRELAHVVAVESGRWLGEPGCDWASQITGASVLPGSGFPKEFWTDETKRYVEITFKNGRLLISGDSAVIAAGGKFTTYHNQYLRDSNGTPLKSHRIIAIEIERILEAHRNHVSAQQAAVLFNRAMTNRPATRTRIGVGNGSLFDKFDSTPATVSVDNIVIGRDGTVYQGTDLAKLDLQTGVYNPNVGMRSNIPGKTPGAALGESVIRLMQIESLVAGAIGLGLVVSGVLVVLRLPIGVTVGLGFLAARLVAIFAAMVLFHASIEKFGQASIPINEQFVVGWWGGTVVALLMVLAAVVLLLLPNVRAYVQASRSNPLRLNLRLPVALVLVGTGGLLLLGHLLAGSGGWAAGGAFAAIVVTVSGGAVFAIRGRTA